MSVPRFHSLVRITYGDHKMAIKVRDSNEAEVIKTAIRNRLELPPNADFFLTKRGRDWPVNDKLDTGSYTLTIGTLVEIVMKAARPAVATPQHILVVEEEEEEEAAEETGSPGILTPRVVSYPKGYSRNRRRVGVSAEVDQVEDGWTPKPIPKTQGALKRIKKATAQSFLFNSLTASQKADIYDCMEEQKVKNGTTVIKQYDSGDYFYVVDAGHFDVFIQKSPEAKAAKVFTYKDSGSFGEISLMYNSPRTATVVAVTDGILWAVDRATFRHIVVTNARRLSTKREQWLRKVDILKGLTPQELSQVADFLSTKSYSDGDYVIRRGEQGAMFYIVEEGEAVATFTDASGKEEELRHMGPGEYFGERALITNEVRSANVKAVGALRVACVDRATFERRFGSTRALLQTRMKDYKFV